MILFSQQKLNNQQPVARENIEIETDGRQREMLIQQPPARQKEWA